MHRRRDRRRHSGDRWHQANMVAGDATATGLDRSEGSGLVRRQQRNQPIVVAGRRLSLLACTKIGFFRCNSNPNCKEGASMPLATQSTKVALAMVMAFVGSQVSAQSASSADAEIAALKKQLRLMEEKLDRLQKRTAANTAAADKANAKTETNAKLSVDANGVVPVKAPAAPRDTIVKMPNNRPTICTADEQNCIALTSRLDFDAGGYDYRPNTANTKPQRLDDGVNARRARIGVLGKFLGDWNYVLFYDFAGSSDGFAGTASAGGTTVGFLPGGGLSGIENAYLSYTGFKPFGGRLAIEGGYMDLPYTLDEASSSNDIPFM